MRLVRLFHHEKLPFSGLVALDRDGVHKVARVLKMRIGDKVELVCGDGNDYLGKIAAIARNEVMVDIHGMRANPNRPILDLHLYPSLLKGDQMDWVLQKAVELGATHIVPVESVRSERRFDAARWEKKSQHWQGILIASALQCGRAEWPLLAAPQKFTDILTAPPPAELNLIFSPHDTPAPLPAAVSAIALMLGPEGGFDEVEVLRAQDCGWQVHALGSRILRADTAAIAAMTAAQLHYGDFHPWSS